MTGEKPELISTVWSRRKKQTFNQHRIKKLRIFKNEERFRNLWDNFKRYNIQITGVPKEEKELDIENLFEKNTERKLP